MNIDTLTIARELRAADLPPEHAEAIAAAIGRAVAESSATKADLDLVRASIEAKIDQLRGNGDARIEQLRGNVDARIEQLRTEIERARNQTILWLMGSQVAIAGLVLAVLKL